MRRIRQLVITVSLLCLVGMSHPGLAETEDPVESRGLNLPRITVPPPPPPPTLQSLIIRIVGEGRGTVTLPPAAACPPACSTSYPQNAPVVLAAIPAPGSTFAGWGGDCRGTAPCSLKMERPHTVEAKFNKFQSSSSSTQSPVATTMTPSAPAPIPIPYPNIGGPALTPELAAISTMLADGKPTGAMLDMWNAYVTRQIQAKKPLNVQDTILQVQRQAEAQVNARTAAQKARLSAKMNSVGDDAQLANLELQNVVQKQQQILQVISNIIKMMHDQAMAVIQNMKG